MADTLEIFGTEYTNVTGIIATTPNDTDLTYIRPQGTKSISANGTGIDVAAYASVDVSVSGSLDIPTFTIVWNDAWDTVISASCDKTYQECRDYCNSSVCYANLHESDQSLTSESDSSMICVIMNDTYLKYIAYYGNIKNGIYLDILYDIHDITVLYPSTILETKNVTQNSTVVASDDKILGSVVVNVPSTTPTLQNKTISPSESQQSVQADSGYDGLDTVTVNAISSTYVGSGITQRDSDDLTVSGATVTTPAGYYSAAAQKSVASGNASAPSSISGTSASVTTGTNTLTLTKTISVTPVVSAGYVSSGTATNSSVSLTTSIPVNPTVTASGATITIPTGYYTTQTTKSVDSGSATAPSTINGTAASVSTGTNTLTLTKTVSVTPVVSAGYVSSGTATNSSVSLTASVTTKAAATITPGTTNQTIAAGTYLTGTQTIAGDADLVASNIASGVQIFGVNGTFTADATAETTDVISGKTAYVNGREIQGTLVVNHYYTGTTDPSSSLGSNGDIYLKQ